MKRKPSYSDHSGKPELVIVDPHLFTLEDYWFFKSQYEALGIRCEYGTPEDVLRYQPLPVTLRKPERLRGRNAFMRGWYFTRDNLNENMSADLRAARSAAMVRDIVTGRP